MSSPILNDCTTSYNFLKIEDNLKIGWQLLQSFHNPDFSPRDFHLPRVVKKYLGGTHFVNDEEIQHKTLMVT